VAEIEKEKEAGEFLSLSAVSSADLGNCRGGKKEVAIGCNSRWTSSHVAATSRGRGVDISLVACRPIGDYSVIVHIFPCNDLRCAVVRKH
jgi:hypothetical protein